jgi:hypothetical protein
MVVPQVISDADVELAHLASAPGALGRLGQKRQPRSVGRDYSRKARCQQTRDTPLSASVIHQ